MIKNSTLWNYLLNTDLDSFDIDFLGVSDKDKTLKLSPRKETVSTILSYAKSLKSISTSSGKKILYNLN
tara:strand:- start:208 stop:414 length:207 start_codon:yes stop_codon:yes gene_type:complete